MKSLIVFGIVVGLVVSTFAGPAEAQSELEDLKTKIANLENQLIAAQSNTVDRFSFRVVQSMQTGTYIAPGDVARIRTAMLPDLQRKCVEKADGRPNATILQEDCTYHDGGGCGLNSYAITCSGVCMFKNQ